MDAILDDVRTAYEAGNLVLFIGAGVSTAGGLPTWSAIADKLLERVRLLPGKSAEADEIQEYINNRNYLDAISAAKHTMGAIEFGVLIEKELNDGDKEIPEILNALKSLKPRLHMIITTNLDRFIERTFDWASTTVATGDLAQRSKYIFKLHGTLIDRSTWTFSREQYDRTMFASPQLQSCFSALFRSKSILFVGCSLTDANLDQTFASVRALSGEQPPVHFAIMPGPLPAYRRHKLQETGVRLVEYQVEAGSHEGALDIIRAIATPRP